MDGVSGSFPHGLGDEADTRRLYLNLDRLEPFLIVSCASIHYHSLFTAKSRSLAGYTTASDLY
jgi:hypothetical protein